MKLHQRLTKTEVLIQFAMKQLYLTCYFGAERQDINSRKQTAKLVLEARSIKSSHSSTGPSLITIL
jgi:hypothetical protein